MPFVPSGKKTKKKREQSVRRATGEALIDHVVMRAQLAAQLAPGLCLPVCVLVQRVLAKTLPARGFALRLGSLHVLSRDPETGSISFDPRNPDGTTPAPGRLPSDTPFHAWLEDSRGELLDPSILVTLHAEGYDVDSETYVHGGGRDFDLQGLRFVYEELHELELLGVKESEEHLDRAVSFVLTGEPHAHNLGPNFLDLAWRVPHRA